MSSVSTNIESVLQEGRVFAPPAEFSESAHVKSMEEFEALRREAHDSPEEFWARLAEGELHWFKKWDTVLKWEPPHAEWFVGGKINISYNCLDRHLQTWRRNKAAIIWEGEPGEQRTLTYAQLHREVSRFANVLKRAGAPRAAASRAARGGGGGGAGPAPPAPRRAPPRAGAPPARASARRTRSS